MIFYGKKLWKYTKIIAVFEQIYSFRTLIYYVTMEKAMILWKKNYGAMKKTMVLWKENMILYRKLWNFDLLWKKLLYYERNYGTIVNYC